MSSVLKRAAVREQRFWVKELHDVGVEIRGIKAMLEQRAKDKSEIDGLTIGNADLQGQVKIAKEELKGLLKQV